MATQETSPEEKKHLLKQSRIQLNLQTILTCRKMINAINQAVVRQPDISEQAAEVIKLEQELITKFTNEIRGIKDE